MSQDYFRKHTVIIRRPSEISSGVIRAQEEINNIYPLSTPINLQRRLSTVSQIYVPHGGEYHAQEHVPPIGSESQKPFILTTIEDDQTTREQRSLSFITQVYPS